MNNRHMGKLSCLVSAPRPGLEDPLRARLNSRLSRHERHPTMTSQNATPSDNASVSPSPAPDAAITQAALARNKPILDAAADARDRPPGEVPRPDGAPHAVRRRCGSTSRARGDQERGEPGHARPRGQHPPGQRGEARRGPGERHPRRSTRSTGARACASSVRAGWRSIPAHEDIAVVVAAAGKNLDGLIFPKTETPDEVPEHRRDAHGARAQARAARGEDQHPGAHRERQRRGAGLRDRPLVAAALGAHLRGLRLLGIAADDRRAVPHRPPARRSRARAHREGGGERQHPGDRRDDAQLPDEGEVRRREEGRPRGVPARRR